MAHRISHSVREPFAAALLSALGLVLLVGLGSYLRLGLALSAFLALSRRFG